ncbi:hypothetical protein F5Y04DRAFT_278977 [Hypomontagnella monticulosa]|nr:hypothetical protein F5Y04DRAFT_278977 [Hypomontagnella monticulosa]
MLETHYHRSVAFAATIGLSSLYAPPVEAIRIPFLHPLSERNTAGGFQLAQTGQFSGLGLASACEQTLYQTINCDAYVADLGQKVYHGSLGNDSLTDSVCADTCQTALATARTNISDTCASTPNLFEGYPVSALIDSIQTGWNETCLRDIKTSKYCNDIMASWNVTGDIASMPVEQVCSYCLGAKLSMMQSSPYSAYGELYAEQLIYINEHCENSSNPTDQLPNPITVNGTTPASCAGGRTYTTREGDTCDSVALTNSVSGASLYYINPTVANCSIPMPAGKELCMPLKCETTYTVKEGDSCIAVAVDNGVSWQNIVDWNAGLDSRCTNIVSNGTAVGGYWGRVICVSAPGGMTEGDGNSTVPGGGNGGGQGGSGDGYSDEIVAAPNGTVAEGTTRKCGQYEQATDGTSCGVMLARAATPMDLFLAANPSLGTAADCTSNLIVGVWYCLHPFRYWNASTTATVPTTPSATK